jgi:hypothetical protein
LPVAVDLGPFAVGPARRESHQPIVVIVFVELAINPTMAQAGVDGFLARNAGDLRVLLRQLQPKTLRPVGLRRKPRFKVFR